jgi:hypothetical protein
MRKPCSINPVELSAKPTYMLARQNLDFDETNCELSETVVQHSAAQLVWQNRQFWSTIVGSGN